MKGQKFAKTGEISQRNIHFKARSRLKSWFLIVNLIGLFLILCINLTSASLIDDIYAYYSFDQSSGTTAEDSSNNNFDLGVGNSSGWILGKVNNSYIVNNTESINSSITEDSFVTNEFTINFWINRTGDWNATRSVVNKNPSPILGDYSIVPQSNTNKMQYAVRDDDSFTISSSDTIFGLYEWHMVTMNVNSTHASIFIDGTFEDNFTITNFVANDYRPFIFSSESGNHLANATIDELGFWSKSLTPAEITELYNSGNGLNPFVSFPTLIFPENNKVSIFRTNTFNCSSLQVSNLTLYIDGVSKFNINLTQSLQQDVTLDIGTHNWTCGIANATGDLLANNFTLNVSEFIENLNNFTSPVLEGTTNTFTLNVSYDSTRYSNVLGILYYNNTAISSTSNLATDNEVIFTAITSSPQISINANVSFFWEIRLINDTTNFFNTSSNLQDVRNVAIDDCGTFTFNLFNFTLRDEKTQDRLNGTEFNSTIEVEIDIFAIGETTPIIEFNQNFTHNENPRVCFETDLGSTQYQVDAVIRYDADLYSAEFYHIQNATLINSSLNQNIDLFDLLSSQNTNFLVTYTGNDFLPLSDALITIQRNYIEEGVFKTVEIPKTDDNGEAVVHLDVNTVKYTFIVSKNGEILATFDNVAAICQDTIIGDCKINLNQRLSTIENIEWEKLGGITYTMSFEQSTKTVTTIFSTVDGSVKTILLNTTKYDMFGNVSVCSDSLTSSSGTLTCVVPDSFGNITIVSSLFVDGELVTINIFSILPDIADRFGVDTYGLFLILMLTLPLMLISSKIGLIFGVILGFVMGGLLLIFNEPNIFSVTSVVMWVAIAGGIIIWKIQNKGDSV